MPSNLVELSSIDLIVNVQSEIGEFSVGHLRQLLARIEVSLYEKEH